MTKPAVFTSQFPPSEDTFRGALMMRLASGGGDPEELIEDFTEFAEDFSEYFPNDTPVRPEDVEDVVDEVVTEYQRVVTTLSPDAAALLKSLDDLLAAGILYSYGDGFEPAESMEFIEEAHEVLTGEGTTLTGYLYSTIADLDQLVLRQRLEIEYGTFGDDEAEVEALARKAVGVLVGNGLQAAWSGDLEDPIVVEPMVVDAPLSVDDEDEPHSH